MLGISLVSNLLSVSAACEYGDGLWLCGDNKDGNALEQSIYKQHLTTQALFVLSFRQRLATSYSIQQRVCQESYERDSLEYIKPHLILLQAPLS